MYSTDDVMEMYQKTGMLISENIEILQKPIRGYWHLLLINHYEDVVNEQLERLVKSGLYDSAESISVGCLGDYENFKTFQIIIADYPKIKVIDYSNNKSIYEFHTLNILKEDADNSTDGYYIFYFHTKGVSFSKENNRVAFEGGTFWRRFMDEYTISRWKDNIAELDKGYETCGTQLRPTRDFPVHYSGNYFWAKSSYIRLLPKIGELNIKDRFQGEFWLGIKNPVAATLSQEFVDYYSSTVQTVEVEYRQPKTIVHTLCWNTVDEVERATKSLYELNDKDDFTHIICDLGFPLEKSDVIPENIEDEKEENTFLLKKLAQRFGSRYIQMPNRGVSQNWSTIFTEEKLGDGDVLICCDSDERVHPKAVGWVKAMADVIRSGEKYGVVSLVMEEQFAQLNKNNSEEKNIAGHNIIEVRGNAMWAQIGVDCGLLKKIGGVPYPKETPIYGNLEASLLMQMERLNYKWCFLKDKIVKHPEWDFNDLTRQWKHFILDEKNGKQIHFEDFLKLKQQGKA